MERTENGTPITGMIPRYYDAAMRGEINVFQRMGEQIEFILTPNKNTILHIHFTNTQRVVPEFVGGVLRICSALLLKNNVKDETILHIAARYGHHQMVRLLIDYARIILRRDTDGVLAKKLIRALNNEKNTALHEAARYGHKEVVRILIEEETNHSYFGKNDDGETPLYIAVERKHWDVVDTLLLANTNSLQYDGPNGRTALHAATIFGDKDQVSKLLTRNLFLAKQADDNGWLPLHLAAIVGDEETVELLVSEDRSTAYMRDNKGRTALHLAALEVNTSAMKMILEYCPDCCELVDEKGRNVLHYTTMNEASYFLGIAVKEGRIFDKVPLMRNLYNERDEEGNTPLQFMAHLAPKWENHRNNHVLLPLLFSRKLDSMACNKYGQNPLDITCADLTRDFAFENDLFWRMNAIGPMLGGRVLSKHLREKGQEKRHDPAVDEKEKGNKTNGEDDVSAIAAQYLSVMAILIATITFTAGFTLPGGLHQDKGFPLLKYDAAFIAFVITDSLSFVFSTSAVLLIFYALLGNKATRGQFSKVSFYPGPQFVEVSEELVIICFMLTIAATGFMVIAFGTGLYAVLGIARGFGVVTLLIALSFFFILAMVIVAMIKMGSERLKEHEKWKKRREERNNSRHYSLFRVRDMQLSDT